MREQECIVITGEYGIGKTVAGITRYPPSKFSRGFIHDSEGSLNDVLHNLNISNVKRGHYVDTRERFPGIDTGEILEQIASGENLPWVSDDQRYAMVQYYKFVIQDIADNLAKGKFDWVLFDTLEKLEAGMVAWVESNKSLSGFKTDNWGQKWWGAVYPLYETLLKGIWARGVKSVIFTSHLKNVVEGKRAVPGKYKMSGKPLLYRLATFMVWLVKDVNNPRGEPAGLVLKSRYGDLGVDLEADTWNPKRLLPPRIPKFTWAEVERYIQTGCYDPQNPLPGEVLKEHEHNLVAPILSAKQLDLMVEEAKLERAQIESRSIDLPGASTLGKKKPDEGIVNRIKELQLDNSPSDIRQMLKAEGYKLPDIITAQKSLNGG